MTANEPSDDRPVVIVGYVSVSLESLTQFQPERSVVVIVEPDIVRKRDVRAAIGEFAVVRELIEWEYERDGAADEFYNRHRDLRPAAIAPLVEYATPFAARLSERYGLPGATLGAALLLRDKALLRGVAGSAGIANPEFAAVASPDDVRAFMRSHPGPVVLKPANRQAAVGTMIIDEPDEVDSAWAACTDQDEGVMVSDRPVPVRMLAERYVSGHEYSVEMLVAAGQPLFANVTDKILFPGPRPIEAGHVVPAPIPETLDSLLRRQTERLIHAVGFSTGIVHCEWILSGDVPYLVECAGRFAGDGIIELIQRAYSVELVRSFYTVLRGAPLPEQLPIRAEQVAVVRFFHVGPGEVESVDGLDAARAVPGVVSCDVRFHPGDRTRELHSSWDRAGMAMACSPTAEEALRRTAQALELVSVKVRPT